MSLEEEEEETDGDVSDAILDELDPADLDDEDVLEGEVPVPVVPVELDEEEGEDAAVKAFFNDDGTGEDEDVDADYDSFDDKDDL